MGNVLDSIGENIIIADKSFTIRWMNAYAARLFEVVVPLYGLSSPEDLIGMSMDRFHKQPSYQQHIMENLTEGHRARIKIKDRFVADIVVTTIKNEINEIEGYVVMLMDVTTKAEEER
ncbi:hypothetical protein ACFQPF_06750 [Fictibacillus iocasae]|uniref:PAS domain-containing protein n=1 Tax=Fictibacillus iocasae TaxID=2715437 RepID=A0ABW2NQ81_9BACL